MHVKSLTAILAVVLILGISAPALGSPQCDKTITTAGYDFCSNTASSMDICKNSTPTGYQYAGGTTKYGGALCIHIKKDQSSQFLKDAALDDIHKFLRSYFGGETNATSMAEFYHGGVRCDVEAAYEKNKDIKMCGMIINDVEPFRDGKYWNYGKFHKYCDNFRSVGTTWYYDGGTTKNFVRNDTAGVCFYTNFVLYASGPSGPSAVQITGTSAIEIADNLRQKILFEVQKGYTKEAKCIGEFQTDGNKVCIAKGGYSEWHSDPKYMGTFIWRGADYVLLSEKPTTVSAEEGLWNLLFGKDKKYEKDVVDEAKRLCENGNNTLIQTLVGYYYQSSMDFYNIRFNKMDDWNKSVRSQIDKLGEVCRHSEFACPAPDSNCEHKYSENYCMFGIYYRARDVLKSNYNYENVTPYFQAYNGTIARDIEPKKGAMIEECKNVIELRERDALAFEENCRTYGPKYIQKEDFDIACKKTPALENEILRARLSRCIGIFNCSSYQFEGFMNAYNSKCVKTTGDCPAKLGFAEYETVGDKYVYDGWFEKGKEHYNIALRELNATPELEKLRSKLTELLGAGQAVTGRYMYKYELGEVKRNIAKLEQNLERLYIKLERYDKLVELTSLYGKADIAIFYFNTTRNATGAIKMADGNYDGLIQFINKAGNGGALREACLAYANALSDKPVDYGHIRSLLACKQAGIEFGPELDKKVGALDDCSRLTGQLSWKEMSAWNPATAEKCCAKNNFECMMEISPAARKNTATLCENLTSSKKISAEATKNVASCYAAAGMNEKVNEMMKAYLKMPQNTSVECLAFGTAAMLNGICSEYLSPDFKMAFGGMEQRQNFDASALKSVCTFKTDKATAKEMLLKAAECHSKCQNAACRSVFGITVMCDCSKEGKTEYGWSALPFYTQPIFFYEMAGESGKAKSAALKAGEWLAEYSKRHMENAKGTNAKLNKFLMDSGKIHKKLEEAPVGRAELENYTAGLDDIDLSDLIYDYRSADVAYLLIYDLCKKYGCDVEKYTRTHISYAGSVGVREARGGFYVTEAESYLSRGDVVATELAYRSASAIDGDKSRLLFLDYVKRGIPRERAMGCLRESGYETCNALMKAELENAAEPANVRLLEANEKAKLTDQRRLCLLTRTNEPIEWLDYGKCEPYLYSKNPIPGRSGIVVSLKSAFYELLGRIFGKR